MDITFEKRVEKLKMENRSKSFLEFPFLHYDDSRKIIEEICKSIDDPDSEYIEVGCFADEYVALYELACGYHHSNPETEGYIIDCGTNCGASASVLASAIRDSNRLKPVITLDVYHYNPEAPNDASTETFTRKYLKSRETFFRLGLAHKYVCPVIFEDHKFLNFWNLPARLIFIDTSHTYEHTKIEIEKALPHIIDDGWLVLHDYGDESYNGQVKAAVNEFLDNQTTYELNVYFTPRSLVLLHINGRKS